MARVMEKFIVASMFMWIVPVVILYGFNHNLFPVISVNIVIIFYICMAMKEPMVKHEPDPSFLAEAKASITRPESEASSSQSRDKHE